MRLEDGPAFAVGLDMELPYCPVPLIVAVRLFWHLDPIRVASLAIDVEAAPDLPPPAPVPAATAAGTLH